MKIIMKRQLYLLIATGRKPEDIKESFESLINCDIGELQITVFIIENGAQRGIQELIDQLKNQQIKIKYLFCKEKGKSLALNFGLNHIKDDNALILMADDDVIYNKDWFLNYYQASLKYPNNAFFGGGIDVEYECPPPKELIPYFPYSMIGVNDDTYQNDKNMIFFGANWAAYLNDLKSLGGFSTKFGPGGTHNATGQETEMQKRLLKAKVNKVYVSNNPVLHKVSKTQFETQWLFDRINKSARSKTLRIEKNWKKRTFLVLFFPIYVYIKFLREEKMLNLCYSPKLTFYYLVYKNLIQ